MGRPRSGRCLIFRSPRRPRTYPKSGRSGHRVPSPTRGLLRYRRSAFLDELNPAVDLEIDSVDGAIVHEEERAVHDVFRRSEPPGRSGGDHVAER